MRRFSFLASVLLVLTGSNVRAESTFVPSPDGGRLPVLIDLPRGDGKFPAIVLAPGQGYHMTLPAMAATARALTEQGVAVFRFNWAYFSTEPKGQPSPDLSRELQDLQAVLNAARAHPRVSAQQLSVGGKSLGSVVAWRAMVSDKQIRSGLFLTPICSRLSKGESVPKSEARENYPGFEADQRPTLWVSGDQDPLCSPTVLYGFAATGPKTARVAIVGGDHGYEDRTLPSGAAEAVRRRNLDAVSAVAAAFVAESTHQRP
jgi:predicted alpha/beta-hydrolase family hydrolase